MTADLVSAAPPALTEAEANRLVLKADLRLDMVVSNWEAVLPMMRELLEREAHVALGYPSAGALFKDRFGAKLARLSPDFRRELVSELTAQGLSTRALAPVFDVNQATIARDLRAGDASASPAVVVGIDGKSYQPRAQLESPTAHLDDVDNSCTPGSTTHERPRPPFSKTCGNLGWDLQKMTARIQKFHADDRYAKQVPDQVAFQNCVRQMLRLLAELEAEFPPEVHLD